MSHDPQTPLGQSDSLPLVGPELAQPTKSGGYQTGYKPLSSYGQHQELTLELLKEAVNKILNDQGPVYKTLSWDVETASLSGKSLATPSQSPGPPPIATPQRISRPLDLRKAIEIRLTEEEAQLAMSPVPEVVPSSPPPSKSVLGPEPPTPKCLGKPLSPWHYSVAKKKADQLKNGTWTSALYKKTGEVLWMQHPVTKEQWLDNFAQYEKAYLDLQASNQPKETSSGEESDKADDIPF